MNRNVTFQIELMCKMKGEVSSKRLHIVLNIKEHEEEFHHIIKFTFKFKLHAKYIVIKI